MKKALFFLPLLLGLAACTTTKDLNAMKPGQTAQKFHLERKQVLAADYLLFLPAGYGADPVDDYPWTSAAGYRTSVAQALRPAP